MGSEQLQIRMPDLGGRRGVVSDWVTQRWVQATGHRIDLSDHPWLEGPVGDVTVIGSGFFRRVAARQGLRIRTDGKPHGLLENFRDLEGLKCQTHGCHPAVAQFYEQTSEFDLDVWSEWCGAFRPFGAALAAIFSRRLQQLNMPLSPLDTSGGLRSDLLQLEDATGSVKYTAWIREVASTGQILYASSYSVCTVPGFDARCVKVVFPLPNGNATVIMKAQTDEDGSFTLRSSGRRFGDPGFYFFVESSPGHGWARYVRTMRETIRVFVDEREQLRANHDFEIWRTIFLRLHYRMRRKSG